MNSLPLQDHMQQYNWVHLQGPGMSCKQVHPNTSCLYEICYSKFYLNLKKATKLYLTLHIISFLIFRAKKVKNGRDLRTALWKLLKTYVRSVLFMSTMVSGIKVFHCLNNKLNGDQPKLVPKFFIWGGILASASIYCEEPSRRQQVVYFILVRAIRSAYIFLKKRRMLVLPYEQKIAFISIFGILSFLYYEKPEVLKHKNMFQGMWGIS